MFKNLYQIVIFSIVVMLSVCVNQVFAQIHFSQDPILMVDPGNKLSTQQEASSAFDYNGNIHTVWIENRTGSDHGFGSALLADGSFVGSYPIYAGMMGDGHGFIRTFPSLVDITKMYSITLNISSSPNYEFCGAELNINDFPSFPTVTDTACVSTNSFGIGVESATVYGGKIFYAIDNTPDIRVRGYDIATQTWDITDAVIPGISSYSNSHPQIAVDGDGYIYVVYDRYDISLSEFNIGACRSQLPADLSSGFYAENVILATSSAWGSFGPEIAVKGSYANSDLLFICTYLDPDSSIVTVGMVFEFMGDWTTSVYLTTIPTTLNEDNSSGIAVHGPESIFDADQETAYVVWSDNRTGTSELYLRAISHDGSVLSDEFLLSDGDSDIIQRPHITAGFNPGDLAITYIDDEEGSDSPFLLLSRSTFYDTCDGDPSLIWTASSGITVDSTKYHSPPASYRMENSMTRGALLQDYGTSEQTGSISLFFYDTPSQTTENFMVTLNNDNVKGVIRMLGVRNETTNTNYSYSLDGVTWVDMGVPRMSGWHELIMTVDESGIRMQMEEWEEAGSFVTVTDPTFTSFTSIEIEGGGSSGAYNVDDIRVEVHPVISEPLLIPSTSPFFMLTCMLILGTLLWFRCK